MILGFTGSQSGMTNFQKEELKKLIEIYKPNEFTNGDCIGADSESIDLALNAAVGAFTLFPSNLTKKRANRFIGCADIWEYVSIDCFSHMVRVRKAPPKPPLERNEDIVNYCDKLIACPKESRHTVRSGTWHTIRLGWKKQKRDKNFKVIIIPPLELTE